MNHEYELEAMMEERDQLRAAVATSKSLNNFNRCTIVPTKLPIDAAGVSVTPGDATNSEFEGWADNASARAQRKPIREDGFTWPSILSSRSASHVGLNRTVRPTSSVPNLAGDFSSRKFRSAIFYSPTVLGACFDTKQPKAVRFSDVQNYFAGKQNA